MGNMPYKNKDDYNAYMRAYRKKKQSRWFDGLEGINTPQNRSKPINHKPKVTREIVKGDLYPKMPDRFQILNIIIKAGRGRITKDEQKVLLTYF